MYTCVHVCVYIFELKYTCISYMSNLPVQKSGYDGPSEWANPIDPLVVPDVLSGRHNDSRPKT